MRVNMELFSKNIICSGDSYTDNLRTGNEGKEVWPDFLAQKLKTKNVINLGSSGAGNYEIYSRTVDSICNIKNISLVVVMWSEFPRIDLEIDMRKFKANKKNPDGHLSYQRLHRGKSQYPVWFENFNPPKLLQWERKGLIEKDGNGKKIEREKWKYQISRFFDVHKTQNDYSGINAFMRYAYSIQSICEIENIPLIQIMGTEPVINEGIYNPTRTKSGLIRSPENLPGERRFHNSWQDACSMVLRHPTLEKIKNNFIGWPMFKEIGGYCVDDLISENDPKWNGMRGNHWPSDFRISEKDSHPSTKGHKFIGEYLYEQSKHLYSDS